MNKLLKRVLKPISTPARLLQQRFFSNHSTKSYAQEGEDMILRRIFEEKLMRKEPGFYVDVGAHHPSRFSNTYFFYRHGWSGLNIDAMPDSMRAFRRVRPTDISIEAAIAKEPRELTFFIFDEPALNTFDAQLARSHQDNTAYRLVQQKQIRTQTLGEVLKQHLPPGQKVDFLSIDVEGLDFEVLQSNDWTLCAPHCILTECLGETLDHIESNPMYSFLKEKGYVLGSKTVNTMIFLRDSL